jgi:hypothetical protein
MQTAQTKSMPVLMPSIKGSTMLAASYALNFLSDQTRSQSLWTLTVILTCLGIYDFILKIRYKHRQDRERKKQERENNEQ